MILLCKIKLCQVKSVYKMKKELAHANDPIIRK
jgi:hypothetical protein